MRDIHFLASGLMLMALAGAVLVFGPRNIDGVASFGRDADSRGRIDILEPSTTTPQSTPSSRIPESRVECDRLASHPVDPGRRAIGVADEQIVPVLAIAACQRAVEAEPDDPRLVFQLGRALWMANRTAEAVEVFAGIAGPPIGFAGANKFLGDAYLEGRGLPPGIEPDPQIALNYYIAASESGFPVDETLIEALRARVEALTFNPDRFHNPEFIALLYAGDLSSLPDNRRAEFLAYLGSMVQYLDSAEAIDHAPLCPTLLNFTSRTGTNFGEMVGAANLLSVLFQSLMRQVLDVGLMFEVGRATDEGRRDALLIIDQDQCDGPVGERLMTNIEGVHELAFAMLQDLVEEYGLEDEVNQMLVGILPHIRF